MLRYVKRQFKDFVQAWVYQIHEGEWDYQFQFGTPPRPLQVELVPSQKLGTNDMDELCSDMPRKCRNQKYGYGSIPINTIFSGMNIHKSQLF